MTQAPNNLAPPIDRFFGREALLRELDSRVADGDRLITLVGPPGAGKTRVALRWAEQERIRADRWPGGIFFIELVEATTASDMVAEMLRCVGSPGADPFDPVDQLRARGALLLILDNFEQLDPTAAVEVEGWCRAAPELRALVTSRARLGVPGEVVLQVGPLDLPPPSAVTAEEILASDAVRLFEARSRAARGAPIDEAALLDVAELVRELDGLPLAIELAAARARVLSPAEIRRRLRPRFQLLSRASRTDDDRHATLEVAIEGSWTGLSSAEQNALAACSVFAGSFSIEAAERLLAADTASPLHHLEVLSDRSLLHREPAAPGAPPAEIRFRLLSCIREFAAARLEESGRTQEAQRHHRDVIVELTRAPFEAFNRLGSAEARAVLERERDNLLAVVRRSLADTGSPSSSEARLLGEAVLALDAVSLERSTQDRLSLIGEAITRADPSFLARLCLARGRILGTRGMAEAAIEDLEQSAELARHEGARAVEAEALILLGVRHRQRGAHAEARALGERAIELITGTEHPRIEAEGVACLGLLFGELGLLALARETDERALAMFRRLGDRGSEGLALGNLAELAHEEGDLDRADRLFEEALSAFRAVHDAAFEAVYLGFHAGLFHERGERASAAAMYDRALELLARAEVGHVGALVLGASASVEAAEGRIEEAERRLLEAEQRLAGSGVPAFSSAVRLHRGHLDLASARRALAAGRRDVARVHLAAARARLNDAAARESSAKVRSAWRLLEREIERFSACDMGDAGLRVSSDGAWFEAFGGARVDLERRAPLRRVLTALLELSQQDRHAALDQDALLAAGWPGERVMPDAASKRIRVAISTLRGLGLSRAILTREDGYTIDPELPVTVVPPSGVRPRDLELVHSSTDRVGGLSIDEPKAVDG